MRRILLIVLATILLVVIAGAAFLYVFLSGDGVRRTMEEQATRWLGQPVRVGAVSLGFIPRVAIRLTDVRVGEPVRLTLGDVDVSTDLRALLRRRIEDGTITLSNSRVEMPLPFSLPEASPGTAPAAPASQPGIELVSIRSIGLRNIRLVSRDREIVVSADSSIRGSELELLQFTAASGKTALEASGVVKLAPRVDAQLRVKANQLDLDELLALAAAFAPPSKPQGPVRNADPIRIAARISSESVSVGTLQAKQFATDFQIDGAAVSLSPVSFQIFGGRYQGSVNARLGNTMAATVRARISDLDVAQLAAFGGVPETVTGTLTSAATVSGQGADVNAILESARGMGTASIVNGTIRRLNLIRTVVLFFGRPDPGAQTSAGDRFERMDATFTLGSQVFRAEAFSMHSQDVDIVGNGSLAVPTKALEGTLDLSLSESLSKQAGTDLARYTREGNRIVLPGKVGGTIAEPKLSIDAAAAARRGLRNEIDRRLKGLLDRFRQN